ncbi:uncharacterized protein PHACADRAFT_96449, partial [Phanerochaete carnosa HHB-10118-sp]
YKLLTSAVIPRPIAFVSTVSSDDIPNLAPMSYFSLVSPCITRVPLTAILTGLLNIQIAHNPPLLSVSFSLSPGKPKDSRENILSTKEFTVSIISEPLVEAANACSVNAPPDVDEWVVSGLTPESSVSGCPNL